MKKEIKTKDELGCFLYSLSYDGIIELRVRRISDIEYEVEYEVEKKEKSKEEIEKEELEKLIKRRVKREDISIYAKAFSEEQKVAIGTPSKWIAKEYFKRGKWNVRWGDASKYGIIVDDREISRIDIADDDFKLMVWAYHGIWNPKWGDVPKKWIKLKSKYSKGL